MPRPITPAILAAADNVDRDLDALDMSTRTLLTLLRANQDTGGGGGGGATTGITALPGSFTDQTTTWQMGWEFTVGGSDIEVTGLRLYPGAATTGVMYLWRVSDSALIRSAALGVTASADVWTSISVTPVTLPSGANYIISYRQTGGSSNKQWADNSGFTFDPAISFVQGRGVNATTFPTTTIASTVRGITDIEFTV